MQFCHSNNKNTCTYFSVLKKNMDVLKTTASETVNEQNGPCYLFYRERHRFIINRKNYIKHK